MIVMLAKHRVSAGGSGNDLLQRAADVTSEEGCPLVIVLRETPLRLSALDNLCDVEHGLYQRWTGATRTVAHVR
jgi:3-polyprenyl-4-hydroxybenzoate decarboxylase